MLAPLQTGRAAAVLTIETITWNVVGLDDQNVQDGYDLYPVGVKICNSGDSAAENLTVTFQWDSENQYLNLLGPAVYLGAGLEAGACRDVYFGVQVSRNSAALYTARAYHITAAADGNLSVSTETPRELVVRPFHLETRPEVVITGPTSLVVGETYTYTVSGEGRADGYEQLVQLLSFPQDLFEIVSIENTFETPAGATSSQIYTDACGWVDDPSSADYLSCAGPDPISGGEVGGSFTTVYQVKTLQAGTASIFHQAYFYDDGVYGYYAREPENGIELVIEQAADTETPTPTGTQTGTATNTSTSTSTASVTTTGTASVTPSQTVTGSPTLTGTATSTSTPTLTGTPPTATMTPTITGTIPTATVTPTITGTFAGAPNPTLTLTVSPAIVNTNGLISFTTLVSNSGGPAANVVVGTTFSSYLSILSASSTKGVRDINTTTRTVTTNLGTLNPSENVSIIVTLRAGSVGNTNITLTQYSTLTFTYNSINYSRTSNYASYRIQGTSTLPGTGGMELSQPLPGQTSSPVRDWLNGSFSVFLVASLLMGKQKGLRRWFWAGLIILGTAVLFAACVPEKSPPESPTPLASAMPALEASELPQVEPSVPPPSEMDAGDVEALPDYEVPEPEVTAGPGQENSLDTSAVTRILIPALDVDTEVKYVPFSGLTWKIAGLQQEVAWLGKSSWPGLGGNTVLAGHVTLRSGAAGPFRELTELKPGDEIFVYTKKNMYVYTMRENRIVDETDLSVMDKVEGNQISLMTCIGYDADLKYYIQRYIVVGDLQRVESLE